MDGGFDEALGMGKQRSFLQEALVPRPVSGSAEAISST